MDTVRTEKLIGEAGVDKLARAHILVCGLGGVGSYVVEALARAGVGHLDLLDFDVVEASNVNRQLFALQSTIGLAKAMVAKLRVQDINADCQIATHTQKLDAESVKSLDFSAYTFVIDAIDDTSAKVELALACSATGTPLLACMGTGNKLHADFVVVDIFATKSCPLARAMRSKYKAVGIQSLPVLYTEAQSLHVEGSPASISYVPAMAGLKCAEYVVTKILN